MSDYNGKKLDLTWNNLFYGKMFDVFAIIHFINGFVFYGIFEQMTNWSHTKIMVVIFILHTIYEMKDFLETYKFLNLEADGIWRIFVGSPPNTFINSIGDTIAFMLGGLFYYYLNKKIDIKWYYIIIGILLYILVLYINSEKSRESWRLLFQRLGF